MNSQLQDLLQANGHRNTQARHAVFALLKAQSPMTTAQLRAKTSTLLNTASLYRSLNIFRELGVVQDVVIGGKRMVELTDLFTPHHHHLSCSGCNKTVELHEDTLERYLASLASKHGFKHQSHSFEITGLCAECLTKSA
jgi:Fur family ferric uptake transcriptional regulator